MCHVAEDQKVHGVLKDHKRLFYNNEYLEQRVPETVKAGYNELQHPDDVRPETPIEVCMHIVLFSS